MKYIVENQGIKTDKPLPMSYEALKAERDALAVRVNALAVENQALKRFGDKLNEMHNDLNGEGTGIQGRAEVACQQAAIEAAMDEFCAITTPATDAALAAIQAQGVEMFADDLHKTAMALCPVKPDNTTTGAYAGLARSFAKKLREEK
ncbi:hypothetical protein [Clostridium perfringens]|uniref:hypothetical protein n=1 Tax=Clostridium perfringens TaxID=1502 RepID=UPI0032216828